VIQNSDANWTYQTDGQRGAAAEWQPYYHLVHRDDGSTAINHWRGAPGETAVAGSLTARLRRPSWAPEQTRGKAHRGKDSAGIDKEEEVNASTRTPLATTAGQGKSGTRGQASTPPSSPPRPTEEGAGAADLQAENWLLGVL
jgi:hypothetical protein